MGTAVLGRGRRDRSVRVPFAGSEAGETAIPEEAVPGRNVERRVHLGCRDGIEGDGMGLRFLFC